VGESGEEENESDAADFDCDAAAYENGDLCHGGLCLYLCLACLYLYLCLGCLCLYLCRPVCRVCRLSGRDRGLYEAENEICKTKALERYFLSSISFFLCRSFTYVPRMASWRSARSRTRAAATANRRTASAGAPTAFVVG
jgi:hypothetical protein